MTLIISILVFVSAFLLIVSLDLVAADIEDYQKGKFVDRIKGRPDPTDGQRRKGPGRGEPYRFTDIPFLSRWMDFTSIEFLIKSVHFSISVNRFLFLSCLSCFVCLIFLLFFSRNGFLSLAGGLGALFLPYGFLLIKRHFREEALLKQLPEAVESISRGLRAGQSVDAAIREVGNTFPPPLSAEFRFLHEEVLMGLPFERALENLAKRFPRLAEIRILSVTFLVQRETGGNLVDTLEGLAAVMRERLRLKRQVKASAAEGRTTALVLGIMPVLFGLLMWMTKPAYMQVLFDNPIGRKLLVAALIMETMGVFLMSYLSRLKI